MKRWLIAVLATLILVGGGMDGSQAATDIAPFMGVGIGRQPSGEPFNIGWAGGKIAESDNGNTQLLATLNYGQFVAENIDALGASLVLKSKWFDFGGVNQPLIKDLWLCLDVGFMDKFHQTGEGDRAIAFKVAPFLSAKITNTFSGQLGYCGFNGGPGEKFESFWWTGITASTSLVFGSK